VTTHDGRELDVERLVHAFRLASTPDERALERVRARLRRDRGTISRAWAVGVLVVVAAALIVAIGSTWWMGTVRVARRDPDAAVHGDRSTRVDAPAPARAPEPWIEAPMPPPQTQPVVQTPTDSRHVAEPRRPAPVDTPEAAADDDLRAETESLASVRATLRGGDPAAALRELDAHARRFTTPRLRLEARALRILALCGAGKHAQGRGEAAVLQREHPDAPYRDAIASACDVR
jgi:hypothetical protein